MGELSWHEAHDGAPSLTGYDGAFLVAQVAFYDVVGGGGPGWVGYVQGERVTGRCPTAEACCALVEERAWRMGV